MGQGDDAIEGEGPTRWATRVDVTNWGLISAHEPGRRVGGAVVAFGTAGVSMLEGRGDLAVLWDIRVHPASRSSGIGSLRSALSKLGLAIGTAAR